MIEINGIRTNNLKNIDVRIKKNSLNLIVGPSGSGKSSLAYDTIAQIGLYELKSMFEDNIREPTYKVQSYKNMTLAIPVRQINNNNNIRSTIATYFGLSSKIITMYAALLKLDEGYFVLNNEKNACERCRGLGFVEQLDVEKIIDYNKTIEENPFKCWQRYGDFYIKILKAFCLENHIDVKKTFNDLSDEVKDLLLFGESNDKYKINYKHGKTNSSRTSKFYGIMTQKPMRKNYKPSKKFYSRIPCPCCKGMKYSTDHIEYKLFGLSIGEFMLCPFGELKPFLEQVKNRIEDKNVRMLVESVLCYVNKAIELNLNHLFLSRTIPTLSGGELQRLLMVRIFNTQLTDLILVFDEPFTEISKDEKETVYKNIMKLRQKHTVIIVDHSNSFIHDAENVIALGEGSGIQGGYLIDEKKYIDNQQRNYKIEKKQVCELININICGNVYVYKGVRVQIAKNCLNLVSGRSGVGKSTLLREYLPRYYSDYLYINQKLILGKRNSNVATLLGIESQIIDLFSEKFKKDKFFFLNKNGGTGACRSCMGIGYHEYKNDRIPCKECNGSGFAQSLKKFKLNGKDLFDIWALTLDEAVLYFNSISKKIERKLNAAKNLALGHLKIGQGASTLSGGENIRIKLLRLESATATVVGIDEPFKGLNTEEIFLVVNYLAKLRDKKTLIIIDHTDSAFRYFDWRIELVVNHNILVSKTIC